MEHNNTQLITTSPAVLHEENEALRTKIEELVNRLQTLQYSLANQEMEENGLHSYRGTAFTQEYYNQLSQKADHLTDAQAKAWIHDEFGFDPAKVEILHQVSTEVETFDRPPIYRRILQNYVRFTVAYNECEWEVADGVLVCYGV